MDGDNLIVLVGRHGCTEALPADRLAGRPATVTFESEAGLVGAFRTMVRERAFDVCEMALTTYLCAKAYDKGFTAIPVFPVRAFHHGAIVGMPAAREAGPASLAGTRVGVNRGYTVTTGVWARGVLDDEHGVDPSSVTWVRSGDEHVAEVRMPPNVEDLAAGGDLAAELAAGRLSAVVGGRIELEGVGPVIAEPAEAGFRALGERGHYPINHCVVVRDELLAADPGLGAALVEEFAAAKRPYVDRLAAGGDGPSAAEDRLYREVLARTGKDPLAYGVPANRKVLDELLRHAQRQQLLPAPVAIESLFAEGTLELEG